MARVHRRQTRGRTRHDHQRGEPPPRRDPRLRRNCVPRRTNPHQRHRDHQGVAAGLTVRRRRRARRKEATRHSEARRVLRTVLWAERRGWRLMSEAPEPILPLSLLAKNRDKFMALFYEPTSTALQTKTNLHLHILRVKNGDFDLPGLYRELKGNSAAYVLSRLNYQKVLDDPSLMMEVASKVQSQFRKPEKSSGEGGEVILYSLLEGHLGAPKVLSKMELKTSSDHYV